MLRQGLRGIWRSHLKLPVGRVRRIPSIVQDVNMLLSQEPYALLLPTVKSPLIYSLPFCTANMSVESESESFPGKKYFTCADRISNEVEYLQRLSEFSINVPAKFNFARDVFDEWASIQSAACAVWIVEEDGSDKKYSYGALKKDSEIFANVLLDLKVGRGDVVFVVLPRVYEWWVVSMACLRIGAILSTGSLQLTEKDVQYRAEKADIKCIIANNDFACKMGKAVDSVDTRIVVCAPESNEHKNWEKYSDLLRKNNDQCIEKVCDSASNEIAMLFFTSGTTGNPKMVSHTHASYPLGHKITGAFWLDLGPGDIHWNLSDTGWAKSLWSFFYGPFNQGATVFALNTDRFDPQSTLKILSKYPITTLCAAPTHYRVFVQETLEDVDFRSLRRCVAAGEPLNPNVIDIWKLHSSLTIADGFGQTETVLLAGTFPGIDAKPGSMGKASPGFDLQIVKDCGTLADGYMEEGTLAIKVDDGPSFSSPVGLFRGYFKDDQKTRDSFVNIVSEGKPQKYYLTGDRVYKDKDDYFWYVSRADDIIISAGYRIGPFEVESALITHPSVLESAVIGAADQMRGSVVKAFIVLTEAYRSKGKDDKGKKLIEELQEHVRKQTSPYKYPRIIEFVDSLPKTSSGKIRRVELRERGKKTETMQ
eukprot:Nk52_evm44s279 gene=Nk52_evmTU44s279